MTPVVVVGQIWIDNDKRLEGKRAVRIDSLDHSHAHCTVGLIVDGAFVPANRRTDILLKRFRPTATGYRLAETP